MNNYHVVIIAAGVSKRIENITRDKPKSFLEIHNKKIIEYTLDIISELNIIDVTIVVGYLKDMFINKIGYSWKNIKINYVVSDNYDSTGHAWSIYQTRNICLKISKPILLIHADIFFDKRILIDVINSEFLNLIAIDQNYKIIDGDEVVICGENNITHSIKKRTEVKDNIVGEIIGINKWSLQFIEDFFNFMENYFEKHGKNINWEFVLDNYINNKIISINYLKCGKYKWININYIRDYYYALDEVYHQLYKKC